MTLQQTLSQIKSVKLTATENVLNFSKKISSKKAKDLNIFLVLNKDAIEQAKEIDKRIKEKKPVGKLAGLCFAVKSNICVKGLETNCASKVLESFIAPYNATIIDKLLTEDAIILGMVNMDEFACGASGETSAFGPTKNPKNPELIAGGSSSGPAAAVAAELCDFAIGSDTGGSIRNPASHCGVVGLKPTYGAVSRYGLIDLAMSTDTIGPLTNTIEDAKLIFDIIKGQDNFDQTTYEMPIPNSQKNPPRIEGVNDLHLHKLKNNANANREMGANANGRELGLTKINQTQNLKSTKLTIGLVNVDKFCDKKISELIKSKTENIAKKNKWEIKEVDLPLDIVIETYYILVYTEFFSATRKFDGRRFGLKIEQAAGPEVIRRIIGGSEITKAEHEGKYYREALKAKNYVKEKFSELFQDIDAIILPTVPRTPHKIGESISVEEMYAYDVFTIPASIAGLPGISVPAGKINNKDIGLQILAPPFQEDLIFKLASEFE